MSKEKGLLANSDLAGYDISRTYPYNKPGHSYENNVILSQNVFLGMDSRYTKRNLNTIILGSEKDCIVKSYYMPNLLQANTSYFVIDRSGMMLNSCGAFFQNQGYRIGIFDPVHANNSFCYNPFKYLRSDDDILVLITYILKNTKVSQAKYDPNNPFLEKGEKLLLHTVISYLKNHRPEPEQNFTSVIELLSSRKTLDEAMEKVGKTDPDDAGYMIYANFKSLGEDSIKAVVGACMERLQIFTEPNVINIMQEGKKASKTIDLGCLHKEKTVIFVITGDEIAGSDFLASMMLYQTADSLFAEIERESKGVEYRVRFFTGDIGRLGYIPEIEKKLAIARLYGMSFAMSVDNVEHLDEIYNADGNKSYRTSAGIFGNCDSHLFFGFSDEKAREMALDHLKSYIRYVGQHKKEKSLFGFLKKKDDRQAIHRDNIDNVESPQEVMDYIEDSDNCIVFVRDFLPFIDQKYNSEKHPNDQYLLRRGKAN